MNTAAHSGLSSKFTGAHQYGANSEDGVYWEACYPWTPEDHALSRGLIKAGSGAIQSAWKKVMELVAYPKRKLTDAGYMLLVKHDPS